MHMDGWVDYLHVEFLGEHVLFYSLRLKSLWSFFLGSIVITVVCLLERYACMHSFPSQQLLVLTKFSTGF